LHKIIRQHKEKLRKAKLCALELGLQVFVMFPLLSYLISSSSLFHFGGRNGVWSSRKNIDSFLVFYYVTLPNVVAINCLFAAHS